MTMTTDTMTRKVDDHEDLLALRERLQEAESQLNAKRQRFEEASQPRKDIEAAAAIFADGGDPSPVRVDIQQLRSDVTIAERGCAIIRDRLTARRNEIALEMAAELEPELLDVVSEIHDRLAGVFDSIQRLADHQHERRTRGVPDAETAVSCCRPFELTTLLRLPPPGEVAYVAGQYYGGQKKYFPQLAESLVGLASRFSE